MSKNQEKKIKIVPDVRKIVIETDGKNITIVKNTFTSVLELHAMLQSILQKIAIK